MMKITKCIILKLGGSLVVPEDIDVRYLKNFKKLVQKHVRRGKRFVIIVGGGQTNRWYRDRAKEIGVKDATDLHWIGTVSTRLNAELVRAVLGKLAHPETYFDYTKRVRWQRPVLVVGGYEPGHSTDFDAVEMAKKYGAKTIVNVTNVESLYTKDPRHFKSARPIKEITWREYRRMFGNPRRHRPGENIPIDAIAAITSQKLRLETFYVGGGDLRNLDRLLSGKPWRGTRIY
jgi:uridylate kinase